MAGSYQHVLDGWDLVENMGDAYETVEQLFWLVERGIGRETAEALLHDEFYPMERGERQPDVHLEFVRSKMETDG